MGQLKPRGEKKDEGNNNTTKKNNKKTTKQNKNLYWKNTQSLSTLRVFVIKI